MKKILCIIIITQLLFTSCNSNNNKDDNKDNDYNQEEVSVVKNFVQEKEKYDLYIEKTDIALGMYEPKNGLYLGAYIMSNGLVDYNIKTFEELTGKLHTTYMNNFNLGDDFPELWILDCIANLKTPTLVIKPPNNYNTFNETFLIKSAKELGTYEIPMFVHFYPNPSLKNYDKNEYISFFQKAYTIFKQYAPKVAMTYSVSQDEIGNFMSYYPGDEYVDWIGLNVYEIAKEDNINNLYGNDVFDIIDYFYYTFQERKPLMVSQLGVSYYTEDNNVYYEKEASNEITRLYLKIKEFYPRIKSIIYMDFKGDGYFAESFKSDNFSITENKTVLKGYKNTIDLSYYLSHLEEPPEDSYTNLLVKSPFPSYKVDNKIYISKKSISFDTDILEVRSENDESILIDGEVYYSSKVIIESGKKNIQVNENNKKVVLEKNIG